MSAIDIGTNSTRLLIANVTQHGEIKVLRSGLRTTRLGEGIQQKKLLPEAMERTLKVIEDYLQISGEYSAENIILGATSAVRDALNQNEFISLVQEKTGYRIKVLSGTEEARLSYLGVVSGLNIEAHSVMVMDVGGGSTEFTWNEGEEVVFKSFNVGAVRMTAAGDSYQEIQEKIAGNIKSLPVKRDQALVGVGGTVTTLAAIKLKLSTYDPQLVHGSILNLNDISKILCLLEQKSLEERKKVTGLQPERADIIVSGVRIVHSIMSLLGQERLVVSEADILYGMALAAADIVEIKIN
ncbi:Ppx/GppA phosphatase family protein [Desulfolucanica intricata]|uniref:Ppx/GppA phosphatase family protein n=1 Tax=Desulfolucanica intricata TaxID=1285191 RepID=UPI0009ECE669|nr:Ppx/GppA phosphatase family protein [Desulfolucanica intricata]